jgi:hypothetical protein
VPLQSRTRRTGALAAFALAVTCPAR